MKILVTGSAGFVGSVLRARLHAGITPFDLPQCDARDFEQLRAAARAHDAVVHLAWDIAENFCTDAIRPDNLLMAHNVYRAAVAAGVPRVVMASSVHADAYDRADPARPLEPLALPTPDSPYGASKVFVEALGRHHAAAHGLVVCCIRFGALADAPHPGWSPAEQAAWLGFDDCAALVQACLDAELPRGHFEVVHGVSRNAHPRHSTRNGLGWSPRQTPPSLVHRAVRRTVGGVRRRFAAGP